MPEGGTAGTSDRPAAARSGSDRPPDPLSGLAPDRIAAEDRAAGRAPSPRAAVPDRAELEPPRPPGRTARLSGPAARARPTPVSTDARLLAIAADHLGARGPRGVTVVAVAAEAGMTHANVYRYFPSKDALLDAVAGRWLRALEADLAGIADAPDPADDKLERLLTALSRAQREARARTPHLFAVHLDATVAARPIARRHRSRLRALVEHVLDEGIATGGFLVRDRDRAAACIFDASFRFTHPLAIHRDAEMPPDLVEARLGAVIQMIQRMLRAGFF